MRKRNKYFKNVHNTKRTHLKNITDASDGDGRTDAEDDAADAPNTADYDSVSTDSKTSPYALIKHNHVRNADGDDADSPDADPPPPDSLIDFKLKRNIDPRSIIKLKKRQ